MPQIIASTYEILSKIGSGGGGVVYLARHLRLEMLVVLKADKRRLSAAPEALRREVDSLKKLTHQYLPKVYDFIEENGVVYTVMDYIEGESLDKPLKRGEVFSQPQVIGMADQLLRALIYLHSRPPHGILHADIKPANIMLTPQGDIRLIDFNIALALGEKGAVRVGLSRGYASPEHYDSDTSAGPITRGLRNRQELPPQEKKEEKEDVDIPTASSDLPANETEDETTAMQNGVFLPENKKISVVSVETAVDLTEETADLPADTVADVLETEKTATEAMPETGDGGIVKTAFLQQSTPPAELKEMVQEETTPEKELPPSAEPKQNAAPSAPSSSSYGTKVLLDVRSDIYSLGATLYHLLTGERPDEKAENVRPIEGHGVSPAVAAILARAMAPDPSQRYQSAQEMLDAFRSLYSKDPRTRRHKRRFRVAVLFSALLFCAGGFSAFVGMKQLERLQTAYVLAAGSTEALERGDAVGALRMALEALPEPRGLFDPPYTAEAERALTDALGVYRIMDGFAVHRTIALDSEPLKLSLSPDGTFAAVRTNGRLSVYETESGELLTEYPAGDSALADVVFADADTLLFAGDSGVRCVSLSKGRELWSTEEATSVAVSEDGTTAALLNRDDSHARILRVSDGSLLRTVSFGGKRQQNAVNDRFADPECDLFTLNSDGSWLAVSFSDGSVEVFSSTDEAQDLTIYGASGFTHVDGGFCGNDFAYALSGGDKNSVFAVVDLVSHEQLGSFTGSSDFHTHADSGGIYVSSGNVLVKLDPRSGKQTELAYTTEDIVDFQVGKEHTIVLTEDGAFSVYNRYAGRIGEIRGENPCDFARMAGNFTVTASMDAPVLRISRLNAHEETTIFTYDASFPHAETRYSAVYDTYLLYQYDAFRLFLADGTTVAEVAVPDAEEVYDQQFRRSAEGDYLEVIYNSGLHRCYSAGDGTLLREFTETPPDMSLYEEFTTERLLVRSPLHGTPTVYDRETGEFLTELETDAYLAYVTQIGDFVMTEYITAEGERYGLLLNEACETVAELPGLCDVFSDGTFLFDDMYGTVRKTRMYSITELLALAKNTAKE